ncbi:hypothetical protein [Catalinimonas alkaloidigena]|uniref:hypothetical protein n=1 Tax=Catalinimonas alkaloidigena TaxID=1075417 RepID=UPI0015A3411C|nr:hypothetical protein [Catalinimonas alkaloidigena]
MSTLYGPDMVSAQWKKGFHAGFFVRHQFNYVAGLHTELLASTRGFIDLNGTRFQFIYASLPVLASLKLNRRTDLLFGPAPGLFIGGMQTEKGKEAAELMPALRRADLSLALGMLFRPNDRYHLGVRVNSGLFPVANGWNAQHLNAQLSLGIYLPQLPR